jgi:hypothetical protein
MKTRVHFIVVGDIKFPCKRSLQVRWCQDVSIAEEVQMLSENATVLFCTYIVSPPAITSTYIIRITRTDFGDSHFPDDKNRHGRFICHSAV